MASWRVFIQTRILVNSNERSSLPTYKAAGMIQCYATPGQKEDFAAREKYLAASLDRE